MVFTLQAVDARSLIANDFLYGSFDRVDVSNLTDLAWVGLEGVLSLGQLLKSKSENPHATIISLFLNYHADAEQWMTEATNSSESKRAARAAMALFPPTRPRGMMDPAAVRLMFVSEYLKNFNTLWDKYRTNLMFAPVAQQMGMKMRKNKIMMEMPYALPNRNGDKSKILEAMKMLDISGLHGHERYVEWVRA